MKNLHLFIPKFLGFDETFVRYAEYFHPCRYINMETDLYNLNFLTLQKRYLYLLICKKSQSKSILPSNKSEYILKVN